MIFHHLIIVRSLTALQRKVQTTHTAPGITYNTVAGDVGSATNNTEKQIQISWLHQHFSCLPRSFKR